MTSKVKTGTFSFKLKNMIEQGDVTGDFPVSGLTHVDSNRTRVGCASSRCKMWVHCIFSSPSQSPRRAFALPGVHIDVFFIFLRSPYYSNLRKN